jgi:phage baseplate assembly protein W
VQEEATPTIPAEVNVSPFDRAVSLGPQAHLGFGLLRPFRRDEKNDFANAGGLALVKSAVGQILGTFAASDVVQGELRWNTEFGSLLYLLRHTNNDEIIADLARFYILEALQRWEPRVLIKAIEFERKSDGVNGLNILEIRLVYDIIRLNVPGNQVFLPNISQVVQVPG